MATKWLQSATPARTLRTTSEASRFEGPCEARMACWVKNFDWSDKMSGLASNNRIRADHIGLARQSIDPNQPMDRLASSSVDVNGAAPTEFVIPARNEASQLAWMLERGAAAAVGYVVFMVDADASMSDSRPADNPPETHPTLHREPVG
jgi:hypothetical protein